MLAAPLATAQTRPIQWKRNAKQAVEQAQKTARPLMFYITGGRRSRDDDLKDDQQRAFRDPVVVALAERFVPIQIFRSQHTDLIAQWGLRPDVNLEIVFVTPAGEKLDNLSPLGAADPEVLARKLGLVFDYYRNRLFTEDYQPLLQNEQTSPGELTKILERIAEFTITAADATILELLKRDPLSPAVRTQALKTLAALSTPAAVSYLLDCATTDEQASAVLLRCTPAAAESMLPRLEEGSAEECIIVYRALTTICKIRDKRPDRFWQGSIRSIKQKEIKRVSKIVRRTAQRWRETYGQYR